MRFTILFENSALEGFVPSWGFSTLIETSEGKSLLFDTGNSYAIWETNARKLNVNLSDFGHIFLSHFHWDHIGGAIDIAFLSKERKHFVVTDGFSKIFVKQLVELGHDVSLAREPYRFDGNFLSTGALRAKGYKYSGLLEQSLIVFEADRYALVCGCSHPGIENIVAYAIELTGKPPTLVLGGFHLMDKTPQEVEQIALALKSMGVGFVAPCHCTGALAQEIFKEVFGKRYIEAKAGVVIEI
ncbi:MAG: MBL fold metallo-hydrolase [Aquificota bacterium]